MGMQVGGSIGEPGGNLNADINITPFVDVMLVLLVIFMVVAPMLDPNSTVEVNLPTKSGKPLETKQDRLLLNIDPKGQGYLGLAGKRGTPLTWQEIRVKLSTNPYVKEGKPLYIRADKTLPYEFVISAMSYAQDSGVGQVFLETQAGDATSPADLDRKTAASSP